LGAAGEPHQVKAGPVAKLLNDLQTLIRNQFAALDARARNSIVEFIASSSLDAGDDSTDRLRLSRSSSLVRNMLRERLPICELKPSRIEGLAVEALIALDDVSFYIEGWLCDGESDAVRMTAVSPRGSEE